MARNSQPVVGLLIALCIAGALAAKDESFFADILASSRVSKVKTAGSGGYDYAKTELSCLSQLNFKSCRYTGCPSCLFEQREEGDGKLEYEFGFTNVAFQTDFTCCPKDLSYGYDANQDVGDVSDKVATCDWEVSIYRWPNFLGGGGTGKSATDITPVRIDDNTVKFGTAWGTCYLNAEAENCDHPLCERMAINVQGGIYVAKAYGDSSEKTAPTYTETCGNQPPNLPPIVFDPIVPPGVPGGAGTKKPAAGAKQDSNQSNGSTPSLFSTLFDGLLDLGNKILDCGPSIDFEIQTGNGRKAAKKQATAETQSAEGYEYETRSLHPGCALIISGPFSVTSKHDDKIAESGLFEFAPIFVPSGAEAVSEPTERLPLVHGKGAKIRFTKEEEGKYDSYYRETDREYRDPARDDSYRGYYENKKEKPNRQ